MAKSLSSSKQTAALTGLGYLGTGAWQGVVCLPDDKSFGCQLKRIVGTVQGIAFLVFKNRKNLFKM